jgi:RHS repeat-associated protein
MPAAILPAESATAFPVRLKLPLPLSREKPQSDGVRAAPQYALPLAAAAWRGERAPAPLSSCPKTRVGVFCHRAPGRHRARRTQVAPRAPGCRVRSYETVSGRGFWLSRDPIAEQGGLNLYGYVGNNPVNAIDLDGLLIVYVHGTWSNSVGAFPMDFVRDVQGHFGNDNAVRFFNWSGENNDAARSAAATALANMLRDYHKKNPCDPIRVVAHSHGGNVALLASQQSDVHIDELVTLGTPALSRYARGAGLTNWDNVYSTDDGVQTLPMGAGRTNSTANSNIQLSGYGHSDLHTVPAWNAAFPAPPTPPHN